MHGELLREEDRILAAIVEADLIILDDACIKVDEEIRPLPARDANARAFQRRGKGRQGSGPRDGTWSI